MQTPPGTTSVHRFSHLSIPRQRLIRLCQRTNYGFIRDLEVKQGQPMFDPPPVVVMDLKLDSADGPRLETELADFCLPGEVVKLMERLDQLMTTKVESLEVRAGIPRRLVVRIAAPPTTTEYDGQEWGARR